MFGYNGSVTLKKFCYLRLCELKAGFSVSITSKVCFLFILIKQKHSAVSKNSCLFVVHSWGIK